MIKFTNALLLWIESPIINGTHITAVDIILSNKSAFPLIFYFKNKNIHDEYMNNYSYIFLLLHNYDIHILIHTSTNVLYIENLYSSTASILKRIIHNKIIWKTLHIILSTSFFENKMFDKNTQFYRYMYARKADIYLYGQSFYQTLCQDFNYTLFRPLLSYTRLQYLQSAFDVYNTSWEVSLTKYHDNEYRKKIFSCNTLYYKRYYLLHNAEIYFEGIGKTLFESILLGKTVYYNCENKSIDDGLTEYMKYFLNIDDSSNIIIHLTMFSEEQLNSLYYSNEIFIW